MVNIIRMHGNFRAAAIDPHQLDWSTPVRTEPTYPIFPDFFQAKYSQFQQFMTFKKTSNNDDIQIKTRESRPPPGIGDPKIQNHILAFLAVTVDSDAIWHD